MMKKSLCLFAASVLGAAAAFAAGAQTATLEVSRMDCAACPITVRRALEKMPGVASAQVDYATKRAVVAFDPARTSTEALTKATAEAGYPSTVVQAR
jgi:mercuric ion binding protein